MGNVSDGVVPGYNSVLKAKWHATKGKPYSNFERLAAQQIAAFWYCWMASNIVDQESHTSLARVLGGVGAAFGAWLVGVIGSETTSCVCSGCVCWGDMVPRLTRHLSHQVEEGGRSHRHYVHRYGLHAHCCW